MTTAWVGFDVSLRMVVCHGLLELAVLLIITLDEEEVSKELQHSMINHLPTAST